MNQAAKIPWKQLGSSIPSRSFCSRPHHGACTRPRHEPRQHISTDRLSCFERMRLYFGPALARRRQRGGGGGRGVAAGVDAGARALGRGRGRGRRAGGGGRVPAHVRGAAPRPVSRLRALLPQPPVHARQRPAPLVDAPKQSVTCDAAAAAAATRAASAEGGRPHLRRVRAAPAAAPRGAVRVPRAPPPALAAAALARLPVHALADQGRVVEAHGGAAPGAGTAAVAAVGAAPLRQHRGRGGRRRLAGARRPAPRRRHHHRDHPRQSLCPGGRGQALPLFIWLAQFRRHRLGPGSWEGGRFFRRHPLRALPATQRAAARRARHLAELASEAADVMRFAATKSTAKLLLSNATTKSGIINDWGDEHVLKRQKWYFHVINFCDKIVY